MHAVRWLALPLSAIVLLAGCTSPSGNAAREPAPSSSPPTDAASPDATSVVPGPTLATSGADLAPMPQTINGLTTLASTIGSGEDVQLPLHTRSGAITFWSGINVGTTTPGQLPGQLSVPAETYRRWFPQMANLGIRFLRTYTILPPFFYEEFRAFNEANPRSPLYLIHGVYLPDESYIETGDLYAPEPTAMFTQELIDASAAASGDLTRAPSPGRASGTWTADVSPWLAGWIIGAELDPHGVAESEITNASAPGFEGTYFRTVADATPVTSTEAWLAARMDELATQEAARGRSMPVAFINWPTDDPLRHPTEANPTEDVVQLDANHVLPTEAWPGGTFASYHAYPYYPDFIRFDPRYQEPLADGSTDAYLSYVADLRQHHAQAGLTTMVTEFGVPASLGLAHYGTNGRDQGDHDEAEAMSMGAQMMRGIKQVGLSGALLFIWQDEWFKFTWNTAPRMTVVHTERRALWHDPLTNEQWFGVLAVDPVGTGWRTPVERAKGPVRAVSINTDPSYAWLAITFAKPPKAPFTLGFDLVDGGRLLPGSPVGKKVNDVAIVVDPDGGTADAYIRPDLNPMLLDGLDPTTIPTADLDGWSLQRMTANRAWPATGGVPAREPEYFEVGRLVHGVLDTESPDYRSTATWTLDGRMLTMRLPWSMLVLGDPSSKTAVIPVGGVPTPEQVDDIRVAIDLGVGPKPLVDIRWEAWNQVAGTERLKPGTEELAAAWRELTP